MQEETVAHLALTLTPGLGPRGAFELCTALGSATAVLSAGRRRLREQPGISAQAVEALGRGDHLDRARALLEATSRAGMTVVGLLEPAYPALLRSVYDPPTVLFVRGSLPGGNSGSQGAVALVGTRAPSGYGLAMATELARDLARAGTTVVSGLAVGVDAAAHRGALAGGGATVAVLASGVDRPTPAANAGLAAEVLRRGGALLSEYPPGTPPARYRFPARNRIISGLAAGVVVVEAGHRSGALITAEAALEQGRAVLAVPGRAGDPRAEGCLDLLRDGAALARGAADVLAELGWRAAPPARMRREQAPEPLLELLESGPRSFDALLQLTGLPVSELLGRLAELELRGRLERDAGGRYRTRERH